MSPDSLSRVPSSTQRILEGVSTDLHGGMAWLQGACEFLGRGHSFLYRCMLLGNKTFHVSWTPESQPSSRLALRPVTPRGGRGLLSSSLPCVDSDHRVVLLFTVVVLLISCPAVGLALQPASPSTRLPVLRESCRGLHLAS